MENGLKNQQTDSENIDESDDNEENIINLEELEQEYKKNPFKYRNKWMRHLDDDENPWPFYGNDVY